MKLSKILKIVASLTGGFFVTGIGILMLPGYLGVVWGLFNAWIWIANPILLLRAVKKQDEEDSLKKV